MVSGVDEARRLVRFEGGRVQPFALPGDLAGTPVQAVAKDAGGQIWLGTSRGLAVLRGDRFEPVELPELGSNSNITDLVASHDGGLWVCSVNHWQRKYRGGR